MEQAFFLAAPLILAIVLGASGIAKLRDSTAARDAFVALRLPWWLVDGPAPRLLPWAELALAVGLLVLPGWPGIVIAGFSAALMICYLGLVARALGFSDPVRCQCFGSWGQRTIGIRTLWRNLLIVGLAALALWAAIADSHSVVLRWRAADGPDWAWLLITILTGALIWLIVSPTSPDEPREHPGIGDSRPQTPFAELTDVGGNQIHLRQLAYERPHLLLFLSPRCGACVYVVGRIKQWQEDFGEAVAIRIVIATGRRTTWEPEEVAELARHGETLFDSGGSLQILMELYRTPSAVLLGTDNRLMEPPALGPNKIEHLVDRTKALPPTLVERRHLG